MTAKYNMKLTILKIKYIPPIPVPMYLMMVPNDVESTPYNHNSPIHNASTPT